MAGKSIFRIDTSELELATRQLAVATGKDLSDALNKKMGWLLRRWFWLIPKADYSKMARQLGMRIRLYQSGERKSKKTGKTIKFKGGWKAQGAGIGNLKTEAGNVAMLVAMISKRKGGSPYKGKSRIAGRRAMAKAVKKRFAGRATSVGYLKSGIVSALKPFLPFSSGKSGVRDPDKSGKPIGRPKGFGTVAKPGNTMFAIAIDKTTTKRQGDKGMMKYSLPALRKAYDLELADTQKFLNDTLYQTARKIGISAKP